jgi:hypothetical protein
LVAHFTAVSDRVRQSDQTARPCNFLAGAFNGDMFPQSAATENLAERHLSRVADLLEAVDPETGQLTFFPYQFDVIPVELISSIYEQFAHSKAGAAASATDPTDDIEPPLEADDGAGEQARASTDAVTPAQAKRRGVHYTRLPVVSLILDEVMHDITGDETVLDLTCGSGVFLVEALRRLVARKGGEAPARELIRSTLYNQVYGVDISDAAIRVAAFSLYLAALDWSYFRYCSGLSTARVCERAEGGASSMGPACCKPDPVADSTCPGQAARVRAA